MILPLLEITQRLIGPITPLGDSSQDEKRLANVNELITLTEALIAEINNLVHYADSHEMSVRVIGAKAKKFMDNLHEQ